MTEKTKRKGNPRRKVPVRLMIIIVLIGGIALWLQQQSRLSPQWITYFTPSYATGQLWLLDVNQPETSIQISESGVYRDEFVAGRHHIFYQTQQAGQEKFMVFDMRDQSQQEIFPCPDDGDTFYCRHYVMSPDGRHLIFTRRYRTPDRDQSITRSIFLFEIATGQATHVIDFELIYVYHEHQKTFQWLDNHRVVFATESQDSHLMKTYHVYDVRQQAILETYPVTNQQYESFEHGVALIVDDETGDDGVLNITATELDLLDGTTRHTIQRDYTDTLKTLIQHRFIDWHPDDGLLLLQYNWRDETSDSMRVELVVINIRTNQERVIKRPSATIYIEDAQFSPDGTQLLLYASHFNGLTGEYLTTLIDIASGEETVLPVAGQYPRWLD